ncbi:hypothetical protein NDU88_006445 [Pleurodeles waltl]|uniref:Uncharacterized protein n=1 Tax=Pleurodeles waltl TaxID=8319 RepID=A0AAV7WAL0_PLEWA|nr:hypothetical protein NDU88_006445 [Pleurodeles waltl]
MPESCAPEEVRFRAAFCVPRSIPVFSVPSRGSPFRVLQNWTDSLGSFCVPPSFTTFALPQDPDHDLGPGTAPSLGAASQPDCGFCCRRGVSSSQRQSKVRGGFYPRSFLQFLPVPERCQLEGGGEERGRTAVGLQPGPLRAGSARHVPVPGAHLSMLGSFVRHPGTTSRHRSTAPGPLLSGLTLRPPSWPVVFLIGSFKIRAKKDRKPPCRCGGGTVGPPGVNRSAMGVDGLSLL